MYISFHGNSFADCVIVTSPKYQEEVGEYRTELTTADAKCKEQTPDGVQSVNFRLCFFGAFAIPAMRLKAGMCIVLAGREVVQERFSHGKNVLDRQIYVDWWQARDIDPLGHLEELKVRRENTIREEENRKQFAHWLTQCKEVIIGWVAEWMKEMKDNKKEKGDKGDGQESERA